jgi:hypothetical protein
MECLGAELGTRATWSGSDNPDFAEDQDALNINEALLETCHLRWDTPSMPTIGSGWLATPAFDLLSGRLAVHPIFALKEPRMCRLLPFWRPVFEAVGCAVSVVEVVRHPMAVALSLAARNRIPIDRGLDLWFDHVQRYQADRDRAWPWVTVEYDAFCRWPEHELDRIATALALEPADRNRPPNIRPELRHHVAGAAPLTPDIAAVWAAAQQRSMA